MAQNSPQDIENSIAIIKDTLTSISAGFKSQLETAAATALSPTDSLAINDVSRQLTNTFRDLNKSVLDVNKNQKDLAKGILKTESIERQINSLHVKRRNLSVLVTEAQLKGIQLNQQHLQNLEVELDKEQELLENDLARVEAIDKAVGVSGKLANSLKNIPGLGKFVDADGLEKSLRSTAAASDDTLSTFSKMEAVGTSLATTFAEVFLSPEAIIAYLISAGLSADKQITNLAKSLTQTKTEALGTRYELSAMANASGDAFITTSKLLEATTKLGQQLGIASTFSADITKEFTTLTGKMGLSEESAGGLAKISIAIGKNARNVTTEALGTAQALQSQYGIQLDNKQILEEVGKISGQLLANFQANPSKIAAAITQAKLLGTTLEQTAKQAESLLDFQSSIENELKAELLTGRQLNLERARSLALMGDQAGVAKELSNQSMNFNEFSKMNVIAQKDFAAALGLSADALSDQLLKQQYIGKSTKEVAALAGEDVAKRLESLTAQDKFNNAILKLEDILVRIIDGPIGFILDKAADLLSLDFKSFVGANDLMSGYGDRTLVTPQGSYALNNNDTVIAGTNLFKGNDVYSGPKGAISLGGEIDYNKLAQAMSKVQVSANVRVNDIATPITIHQQQNMRRSV